jgi:hypothetical protein
MAKAKDDEKAFVPVIEGNTALAVQDEIPGDDGLGDFDQSDIVIPRVKIVQAMSEEGTQGKFRINLTGDEFDSMNVVFLKFSKGRVYFPKDSDADEPTCKSNDGALPASTIEAPIAAKCETCPLSQWSDKKPPQCSETYNFLGVTVEDLFPFWLSLKGMSISPTKRFLSSVKIASKAKGRKLWQAQTTIGVVKAPCEQKVYAINYSGIKWVDDQTIADLREAYAHESIDRAFDAEKAAGEPKEEAENESIPF